MGVQGRGRIIEEAELLPRMGGEVGGDMDTEQTFDDLRESLASSETPQTLWVYRVPTDDQGNVMSNAKVFHLFSAPINRYSLEEIVSRVRAEFMRDRISVCIRLSVSEKGKSGLRLNRMLMVERGEQKAAEVQGGQLHDVAGAISSAIANSNKMTLAMFESIMARMTERPAIAAPAVDPMQQTMAMMAAMTGMVRSLVPTGVQGAPTAAAGGGMLEMINSMRALKKLSGELGGGAGGGGDDDDPDSLQNILKAGAPYVTLLSQVVARQPVQRMPPPARRRLAKPAAETAAPPVAETPPQNTATAAAPEVDQMFAQLRPQLVALCESANENGDPVEAAKLVVQMIPEGSDIENQLLLFLEGDHTWFPQMCAIYPGCAQHQEWFGKLRAAILEEYPADDAAEPG